jgi:hypothetical protein
MRRRRAGRSHGIEVSRRVADNSWDPMSGEMLIRRICVGYEDGRKTCFIPEGGEEFSPKTRRTG